MWKSDNQGIKEVTFTQTGRRGRDMEMGGDVHGGMEAGDMELVVMYPLWWIKIGRDTSGARDPSLIT